MDKLIKFFENHQILRWYDAEIADVLEDRCPERPDLAKYFRTRQGTYYRDEIAKILREKTLSPIDELINRFNKPKYSGFDAAVLCGWSIPERTDFVRYFNAKHMVTGAEAIEYIKNHRESRPLLNEIKPRKAKFAFKGSVHAETLFGVTDTLRPFMHAVDPTETWLEIKTNGISSYFDFTVYTNNETTAKLLRELI